MRIKEERRVRFSQDDTFCAGYTVYEIMMRKVRKVKRYYKSPSSWSGTKERSIVELNNHEYDIKLDFRGIYS